MKKHPLFTILFSLLLFLLSCAHGPQKQKLFIYNWTYYMPQSVLDDFAKKFNVDIVYDVYPSNEDMFAKLKSGATGYDIVVPSGDFVSIMIHENMLEPIDKSKIPNFANIDTSVLSRIKFDKGNKYSVPYMMGASGIAVNKKQVKNYEKSWTIFGRADLKNRMTMLDDMREVLGAALSTLGYSVNTKDSAELAKAELLALSWKRNLVKYDAEAFAKGFAAGEFWVVQGYAENIFREYDSTKLGDIDFFIPREGGPMYMDNMVIVKGARHGDLAHAFINFIHSPEVYARIIDYLGYPCINTAAGPLVKKRSNYSVDDLAKAEFKEDLGPDVARYNKIWEKIRMGN
jgi:spermidine/putrescine transport system substrate-binding protein